MGALLLLVSRLSAADVPEWKDPSKHVVRFVEVEPGVKLEVLDWGGSGEPVLLLAGHGDTGHVFDDFAPELTSSFHVFAVTRRGFGASTQPQQGYDLARMVRDIARVEEALNLKRIHLVGHSIAGDEMTRFALTYPEKVGKLVYLEAAYDRVDAQRLESRFPNLPPLPAAEQESGSPDSVRALIARTEILLPKSEIQATRVFAKAQRDLFRSSVPQAQVDEIDGANHYVFISNRARVLQDTAGPLPSPPDPQTGGRPRRASVSPKTLVCCTPRSFLTGLLALKSEHVPPLAISLDTIRMDRISAKSRDGALPETDGRTIRLHHSHYPRTRKYPPQLVCCLRSQSLPAVGTNDKEFRHVEARLSLRDLSAPLHQSETRDPVIQADKERIMIGFFPIKRKILVSEPAVRTQFKIIELTEIVCVQLEQIADDRFVLWCGGDNPNTRRWLSQIFWHSVGIVCFCSVIALLPLFRAIRMGLVKHTELAGSRPFNVQTALISP